jgi:hypothetical protein
LRTLPEKITTACAAFIRTALAEDPYRMWRASAAGASTQSRYASARPWRAGEIGEPVDAAVAFGRLDQQPARRSATCLG